MTRPAPLSEQEQRDLRTWFREHWERGVAFNWDCGMRVRRWDPDGVEMALPYSERLTAHDGVFHGGLISALIDTAGGGAVMAGHDFAKGSRLSTVSLSVQYLAPALAPEVVAHARCVRRGGRVHFSEVEVRTADGSACARGQVVVSVSGQRSGVLTPIPESHHKGA
ncbi:PaaI family thioesterase [Streptomyces gilvus]|uniref:PaaI family thioesterase n=1 Tax=Streptomyces gilvus TaxID=2920937 RepID=UPI001F1111E7|nr:PaaI family thioesterase [Streptomyces sp. CME 23]MCH5675566.1 PaaI family thioesterase [Streptomyces sp. CME 23]